MTKEEAKKKAIEKSKIVMETLELILTDSMQVDGRMEFDAIKNGNEKVCTLEIYVPKRNYEKGKKNYGLKLENSIGSVVELNFIYKRSKFEELISFFEERKRIK